MDVEQEVQWQGVLNFSGLCLGRRPKPQSVAYDLAGRLVGEMIEEIPPGEDQVTMVQAVLEVLPHPLNPVQPLLTLSRTGCRSAFLLCVFDLLVKEKVSSIQEIDLSDSDMTELVSLSDNGCRLVSSAHGFYLVDRSADAWCTVDRLWRFFGSETPLSDKLKMLAVTYRIRPGQPKDQHDSIDRRLFSRRISLASVISTSSRRVAGTQRRG